MTDGSLSKVEIDVERHLLETTIRLSDGTEGLVFSRGPKNISNVFPYNCHLCGAANLPGERALQTHIAGRKHQRRLVEPAVDSVAFRAPLPTKGANMSIAPGEPVPPGFENEVRRVPELQPFLDSYRSGPAVGLEYVAELNNPSAKEPSYFCLMCDKRGDPRNIIAHITSYNHRLKFLERHFTTIASEIAPYRFNHEARNLMPRLVQSICEAIEEHHGRLTLGVYDSAEFHRNRNRILQDIGRDRHFSEKNGPSFTHVFDRKKIDEQLRSGKNLIDANFVPSKRGDAGHVSSDRHNRDNLDEISSSESDTPLRQRSPRYRAMRRERSRSRSMERFGKRLRRSRSMSISPPPSRRGGASAIVGRVHRSPPFDKREPSKKKSSASLFAKPTGDPKNERFKAMVDEATKVLELELKEHEKNPEKHPLYPEEWKTFWNRRYKELQAEKKDPNKYDYKPEWIVFWTKRMKELHLEQVEQKKEEIRQQCGISNSPIHKLDVVDISDEEISPLTVSPVRSSESERREKKSLMRERERERERSYGQREPPPDYYHARDYPPSQRYGVRYMQPEKLPKYEPEAREEEEEDDGPLTVVAVLRLLTALEENLGSLGPKVIDLLAKALALEKIKPNSSDEMLLNDDTSVFFETVKEKLKGQLLASVLDTNKIKTAKKAVKNIAAILHQVSSKEQPKTDEKEAEDPIKAKLLKTDILDRQLISSKLAASLVVQDKTDISKEDMDRLINVFILIVKLSKERNSHVEVKDILLELGIEPIVFDEDDIISNISKVESKDSHDTASGGNNASGSLDSLTDSDLQTLLQNFKHLSSEEQHHLIAHLKKLESSDPIRVEKLRKFVDVTDLKKTKISSPPPENIAINVTKSNFTDDDFEEKQPTALESDDDDDYNFDDVVKAASNNVKTNSSNKSDDNMRSGSVSRDSDRDHSNLSNMSNIRNQIPQNLIDNLLGSLQQNISSANQNTGNDNRIPTIGSLTANQGQNFNPNNQPTTGRNDFFSQAQSSNSHQMNSQFNNPNFQQQQQQQQQQPINMFDNSFNPNNQMGQQPQPMFGRRPTNNNNPGQGNPNDQFNMQNMSNVPNNYFNQFQSNPGPPQQPGNFMNSQNNQRQNFYNNSLQNPGGYY